MTNRLNIMRCFVAFANWYYIPLRNICSLLNLQLLPGVTSAGVALIKHIEIQASQSLTTIIQLYNIHDVKFDFACTYWINIIAFACGIFVLYCFVDIMQNKRMHFESQLILRLRKNS